MVTDAPAASDDAYAGPAAVTVVPLWVTVAFQPLTRVTPDGQVQVADHGLTVPPPVFFTVSEPWKPPCHALSCLYTAVHAPVAGVDGEVETGVDGEVVVVEPVGGIRYGP